MTRSAFIVDYIRTPIGRYAGRLSSLRTDDLAALPLRELMVRHPQVDWESLIWNMQGILRLHMIA